MRVLRGKEILIKYRGAELVIDYDRLFKDRGEHLSKVKLDKEIAAIFSFIGIFLFVFPLLLSIINGTFTVGMFLLPSRFLNFLPYLSIGFFLYSRYLTRNRDEYNYETGGKSLKSLVKVFNNFTVQHNQIIINDFLSDKLTGIIDKAAFSSQNFILALFDLLLEQSDVADVLTLRLGVDINELRNKITASNEKLLDDSQAMLRDTLINLFDVGLKLEVNRINEFILLFVLNKFYFEDVYRDLGVTDLELEGIKIWYRNLNQKYEYFKKWKRLAKLKPTSDMNKSYTSKATPVLDIYSEDFTAEAAKGDFLLSIGKEKEMGGMIGILERDNNSAVLLLGEPGVGKTRFLKYLATRMVVEDLPWVLYDKRLIVIDLNKALTKTSSIDKFKSILEDILDEVVDAKNIILVLEEIGEILSIRQDFKMEVVNVIVNAIDKYKLKVIATSNYNSYVKYFQPITALASLFENVLLKEPGPEVALQILIDEVSRLESKYRLKIHFDSLKKIVELASKVDMERVMPDKGIDILEEGCIVASSKGLTFVDEGVIDEVVSKKAGIKVGSISNDESLFLKNLEHQLHKRIVGQNEAIIAISNAIKRLRAGLAPNNKPIASFLFFGPTGVGKTEVAKTVADVYYGDEKFMLRLDMSEYQEEDNLKRLIGYSDDNGNFIGGILTEPIRTKPFHLILLDEIEKANKRVLDLFLQVLDEGSLKDGTGRKVDFTNTIIIMTSNVGSKKIADLILQGQKYYDVEKEVLNDLREYFRVEFLNRFDKLIMFTPLTSIEVRSIIEIMLNKVKENLLHKGIEFLWDAKTLDILAKDGYNPNYGARELNRMIADAIEDKLAKLIIDGELKSGNEVIFNGITPVKILN